MTAQEVFNKIMWAEIPYDIKNRIEYETQFGLHLKVEMYKSTYKKMWEDYNIDGVRQLLHNLGYKTSIDILEFECGEIDEKLTISWDFRVEK